MSMIDRINIFVRTTSRPFVLGLPTGSSPLGIYKNLIEKFKSGDISFQNVVTFNMVSNLLFSLLLRTSDPF
jgi:glucosamine-6-phosphate deaminase